MTKLSDEQFREWVQSQASCISGKYSEYVSGEGRNIAAHVRRAGEAGTGYKPPFSCVPLTQAEHDYQHQHGEWALLEVNKTPCATHADAEDWFERKRDHYVRKWLTDLHSIEIKAQRRRG